jgi:hypothetical protein
MIDQPEALSHATELRDRVRREGFPAERAQSLAAIDLRATLLDEVDRVVAAVGSILAISAEPAP